MNNSSNVVPLPTSEPLPILYDHCVRVYEEMARRATPTEVEGSTVLIWEGFTTKLIQNYLNLAVPYYTSITRALLAMGSVRQLRRGGGNTPSAWELIEHPTPKMFAAMKAKKRVRTDAEKRQDQTEQRTRDILRRLTALEEEVKALKGAR